jgi:hypothetical protein
VIGFGLAKILLLTIDFDDEDDRFSRKWENLFSELKFRQNLKMEEKSKLDLFSTFKAHSNFHSFCSNISKQMLANFSSFSASCSTKPRHNSLNLSAATAQQHKISTNRNVTFREHM